jgi:hypothetical protein
MWSIDKKQIVVRAPEKHTDTARKKMIRAPGRKVRVEVYMNKKAVQDNPGGTER